MGGKQFFEQSEYDDDPLMDDLKALIRNHSQSHPRSAQIRLGPSQVGHPCARNVITGLVAGHGEVSRRVNAQFDPLPSYLGVAAHAHMELACALDNEKLGRERWISERKVHVRQDLSGTCDLYDRDTSTVIDFKFPGTTQMAEYRKHGPTPLYKVQAHLYGRGYLNAGYPVERVGIWMVPRSGLLSTSVLWLRPYRQDVVDEVCAKLDAMICLMDELDLDHHPERLALIPITPHECSWCPYYSVIPSANPFACEGDPDLPTTPGRRAKAAEL
jgi:hypothetical protein